MAPRVAALAAFLSTAAAATTYFVSSSLPSASDSNPGTSPAQPWRTLGRVQTVAPTLRGGDAVLLRAGDAWELPSAWFLTGVTGAPGAPVLISSYADAGAGAQRPSIALAGTLARGPVLTLDNATGVTVSGLELSGGENGVAFTWHGAPPPGVEWRDVAVVDCFIHDVHTAGVHNISSISLSNAVGLGADVGGVVVTNVTVAHNIIAHVDAAYGNFLPYAGYTRVYVAGAAIAGNFITRAEFNTVFIDTCEAMHIEGNVFMRDSPSWEFVAGVTDIIFGSVNASTVLVGNEISYRGEFVDGGPDGCAIDFETAAVGVTVADNYLFRSYGAGVMVLGHQTTSQALNISGNRILFCGCNQTRDDHGGISFMHLNSSGSVAGNTFTTCPGVPVFNTPVGAAALDNWTFSGNVIDGEGGAVVAVLPPPVVTGATAPGGGLLLAAAPAPSAYGQTLRYTVDGSRPGPESPEWPAGGLALPGRTVAVLVKALPVAPGGGGLAIVESPSAGGVFYPDAAAAAGAGAGAA